MSAKFHSIGSNPSYVCCICLQRSEEDLQAHNDLHAMHQECIKLWAKNHSTCPVCRVDVDPSSLFSWKERIINRLENVSDRNFIVNTIQNYLPANFIINTLPNYPSANFIVNTVQNYPFAYIGAFMANSSLGRTRAEEQPPVSYKVFTIASAICAIVATRLRRGQNPNIQMLVCCGTLASSYAIVYVARSIY